MDVLDIDDKAVEEFQETRQETPPVVPIALKRHQTAEAVNKTRQQVAPTRDWNQVNSTMQDTMMKVMKYLSTAEETPRYVQTPVDLHMSLVLMETARQ